MTKKLLFSVAILIIGLYCLYIFNPRWAGNPVAYALLILAESISVLYLFGMLWTAFHATTPFLTSDGKRWQARLLKNKFHSKVAVLIPTFKEDTALVESTLAAAVRMKGVRHQTYLLDDAKNPAMRTLAKKYKVTYITRNSNELAKAGNILNALKTLKNVDYVIIFDCDHIPEPNFMIETIPYFCDPELAMVQTPQCYRNENENFIASGASKIQEFFYTYVMPGKNSFNAAFCVGTNMVFRKSALDQIGGYAKKSHSEDIWTSRLLHEAGWKTLFLPMPLAFGLAPNTLESFFNQQYRWCLGGMKMMFYKNSFLSSGLTIDQKLQYFLSNAYYLTGIAMLIYMLLPILYLLFGISPMRTDIDTALWSSRYIPFIVVSLGVFVTTTRSKFIQAATLSIGVIPVYIRAFLAAILGRDMKWHTTNATHNKFITELLYPHFILLGLSVSSVFVGFVTIGYYNRITTFVSIGWALVNSIVLLMFIISAYGVTFVLENPFARLRFNKGMKMEVEKA